jgi:hypothetical protein
MAKNSSPWDSSVNVKQSLLAYTGYDRPDFAPGVTSKSCKLGRVDHWYDQKCFILPQPGVLGNSSRNWMSGPGLTDLDFSLSKNTRISEKLGIQFRWEIFNIFNHPNFANPSPASTGVFTGGINLSPTADPADYVVGSGANGTCKAGTCYNPNAGRITATTTTSREMQFAVKVVF